MQEISTKLDETSPDYKVKFTPASIEFDDYEKLKEETDEIYKRYNGYVVVPENLKGDKAIAADLNKKAKALKAAKSAVRKQALKPLDEFNEQMDALIDEITDVSGQVHQGLKDYREQGIKLRHEANIKHIDKMAEKFGLTHEDIAYDAKWDNKSNNWKKIEETINQLLEKAAQERDFKNEKITLITEAAEKEQILPDSYINLIDDLTISEILARIKSDGKRQRELSSKKDEPVKQAVKGNSVIDTTTGEVVGKTKVAYLKITGSDEQMNNLAEFIKNQGLKVEPIER